MSVKFILRVTASAAAASTMCLTSAAHAAIVIIDGTFADSDWTLVSRPYGTGGGSGSAMQVLSGGAGNNGEARQTTNAAGPDSFSGAYNASIYTAFTYDPAAGGPLTGLSISIDARYTTGSSALGAVVEQNGLIWMAGYAINTPVWQTYTFTPGAGDWFLIDPSGSVSGPGPDFSAAGSPMRFGFYTGNGTGLTGIPYANSGLNDNFVVSFIPAPGAAAVLGLGRLLAARRRR